MARKQFVSSKKNAPSRVVPSKEAALHGRDPETMDEDDDDDDDVLSDNDGDDASMNGGAESPVSSAPSSPISSDVDDDDDDNGGAGDGEMDCDAGNQRVEERDDDDPVDADDIDHTEPVAVQVLPASGGRGKQLRFPVVSRGKEVRMLHNGSDRDGSDSESYASVASDEEEDDGDDEMLPTPTATVVVAVEETVAPLSTKTGTGTASVVSPAKTPTSKTIAAIATGDKDDQDDRDDDTVYPIKAFRARKRHRPDSSYFAHMSTHVRDCLLSIRDTSTTDALSEDAHHDFRRKLSAGTVERVPWKQVSPPPPATAPSDSEKKVPKVSPTGESDRKRAREEQSTSFKASSRKNGDERSDRKPEKSLKSASDKDVKKERSSKEMDTSGSRRDDKDSSRSVDKSKATTTSKRGEENGHGHGTSGASTSEKKFKGDDVVCAKCKKSVSEQNADEAQQKAAAEATAVAAALQTAAAQATLDAAAATTAAAAAANRAPPLAPSPAQRVPVGTFIMPTNANAKRDPIQLREEAGRLNDEARSLKHEGNRLGLADPGPSGQTAQVRYYLRSSAKFFQHALLLADIKAAYREAGDERSARVYGDFSMQTLAQTSSLIESTVRKSRAAENHRLVALAYKLTSIVELTIYRLQHAKLFTLYSNLYTPGRSPDSRQNGSTPPINGTASGSQDNAVKALLLKEMEHTLRGFDMWQRYEGCRVDVLPRVTNPAVVDLTVLFEDLTTELGHS